MVLRKDMMGMIAYHIEPNPTGWYMYRVSSKGGGGAQGKLPPLTAQLPLTQMAMGFPDYH